MKSYGEDDWENSDWVMESNVLCACDGEPIPYMDGCVCMFMVRPFIVNGRLTFFDIKTENEDDYLYEPAFIHVKNWNEIEERFYVYSENRVPVNVHGAIVYCKYCKSGILPGETMCVAPFGEIHRSSRNPDVSEPGDRFEICDPNPTYFCISCIMDLNTDIQEVWADGVCHGEECKDGTYARCWRSGCPGSCTRKESG
jgi:hypothetical protein